ncbi:MAG: EF-P lysine aminoacylase EpmA [Planctomycetota bacterium]|nr:EF-P lysine aminoacylase EpmA [Planctomycetota bacterium]
MSQHEFAPTATWAMLQTRAALWRRLREFFDTHGFLEVETPVLSQDTVIDRHLDPLAVVLPPDPRRPADGPTLWLQTSPEFAMKRLLVAGGPSMYQVTKAFRAAEIGPLHNPEFSLVEWYRLGDSLDQAMHLTSQLAEHLLNRGPAALHSYRQLMRQFADVDPWQCDTESLRKAAVAKGIEIPAQHTPDMLLDLLMTECVEPHLGFQSPAIVFHYPPAQAALAQVVFDRQEQPVAERFELYVNGIELANGYHELLDADEFVRRMQQNNAARLQDGKQPLPEADRFLHAMRQGLPACSGVALGFDRLVMVATGATHIRNVIAFPIDRA